MVTFPPLARGRVVVAAGLAPASLAYDRCDGAVGWPGSRRAASSASSWPNWPTAAYDCRVRYSFASLPSGAMTKTARALVGLALAERHAADAVGLPDAPQL